MITKKKVAYFFKNIDAHVYLGAPASPHIVVATDWLTITHETKVHCRSDQVTVETQIHTTHGEQGALWNGQNSIHIPDKS